MQPRCRSTSSNCKLHFLSFFSRLIFCLQAPHPTSQILTPLHATATCQHQEQCKFFLSFFSSFHACRPNISHAHRMPRSRPYAAALRCMRLAPHSARLAPRATVPLHATATSQHQQRGYHVRFAGLQAQHFTRPAHAPLVPLRCHFQGTRARPLLSSVIR
jgi:hypothetical protein